MKQIVAAACGFWLAVSGPVLAQSQNGVVVELYTSQGCSSCPPADALLQKLADDPRIIALALHVDYWDYLGWKDKFGSPKFTARQKAYANHARDKMVYTPQMIISGGERIVGSHSREVDTAIRKAIAQQPEVKLELARDGANLVIHAAAVKPLNRAMIVQLVRYKPVENVEIKRGENAGKSISYHNIVTSWQPVGKWNGTSPLTLKTPAQGNDQIVVIIQAEGPAEILAAVHLRN